MNRYLFYGLLTLGVLARVTMLVRYGLVSGGEVDVYLADEGVVGLMAMHILEGRELPVFFYGQDYLGALEAYLESGERKIDRWYDRHRVATADFADTPEQFLNINTSRDHAELERRLAGMEA